MQVIKLLSPNLSKLVHAIFYIIDALYYVLQLRKVSLPRQMSVAQYRHPHQLPSFQLSAAGPGQGLCSHAWAYPDAWQVRAMFTFKLRIHVWPQTASSSVWSCIPLFIPHIPRVNQWQPLDRPNTIHGDHHAITQPTSVDMCMVRDESKPMQLYMYIYIYIYMYVVLICGGWPVTINTM